MHSPAFIVESARAWMDTPYAHHGRRKGAACDCVGLIVGVGEDVGLELYTRLDYSDHPRAEKLLRETGAVLEEQIDRDPMVQLVAGEAVAMCVGIASYPQHLAIIGEHNGRLTLIHALQKFGKVSEHSLTDWWRKRIVRVYRYPGVAY